MLADTRVVAVMVSVCAGGSAADAAQVHLPTNLGNGADAEVRESIPDQNRGASTEIATRIVDRVPSGDQADGNDRNSIIYLQFDLTQVDVFTTAGSTLRMTLRNNNISETRIHDTDGVAPDFGKNGLVYYGIPGAAIDEAAITYNTAPGLTPDGDVGTVDFNGAAVPLGERDLPDIGSQNWLAVGMSLDFQSAALDAFLENERMTNPSGVAVIAVARRNLGLVSTSAAPKTGDEPSAWANFNYLFNPKEQTMLNSDSNYDADVNDPNNPLGSPWSGGDNTTGEFSPQLVFVPVPSAVALWGVVGIAVGCRRSR